MNKSYRLVWSAVRGAWTVVSELAKSHAAIEARSGGKIDLSKAALVDLTTGHSVGIWADMANTNINISKLKLNQTRTGTTGYGIRASGLGQITIGELNLTTNQTGVTVDGLNSTLTIGNASTRSTINSSLVGVSATAKGKVNLTNIDITTTGTTNTSTGLNVFSGATATLAGVNTLTPSGAAAAKVGGNGSAINLGGSATLTATGTSASALEVDLGGGVNIAGNSTIKLNSTSGAALKVSGGAAVRDNGETGSVYTLTSGAGEGAAVDLIGGELDLSSAQQITVNASQKTGLSAMTDAVVNLANLTIDQTYAGVSSAEAVGIAATTGAQVNVNNLTLIGNGSGISADGATTVVALTGNTTMTNTNTALTSGFLVSAINTAGFTADKITANHTVATSGTAAPSIVTQKGGTIAITELDLTTNQTGVKVDGADSKVTIGNAATRSKITSTVNEANYVRGNGAWAAGGEVSLENIDISTSGNGDSVGASIGSTLTLNNVTIKNTNTLGGYGISVENGSTVNFQGTTTIENTNGRAGIVLYNGAKTGGILKGSVSITGRGPGVVSGADSINIEDLTITTLGDSGHALTFRAGTQSDVKRGSITTGNVLNPVGTQFSRGVWAQTQGTAFTMTGTTITTLSNISEGVLLDSGTMATLTDVNINTAGANSAGIKADGTSTVNFAGTNNITTKGNNSTGLLLSNGSTATGTLTGNIHTFGSSSAGIESAAANLAVANSVVTTECLSTQGILIRTGGLTLTDSSINVKNGNSVGIKLDGSEASIDKTNITTEGKYAVGLITRANATTTTGSNLTLTDSTITTQNSDSTGIDLSEGTGAIVNSSITTKANDSQGISAMWTEDLTVENSTVSTSGTNSIGINLRGSNTVNFVGTNSITTTSDNSVGLKTSIADKVNFGGTLNITTAGTNSTALLVDAGAIVNARDVVIDPSTWNITGNSDMVNLTNDASDFRFVNANGTTPDAAYSDFKTVTVNTYTGSNAANIYMNTRLNGDDVTGAGSDKIVVRDGGNMSGDTTFHFNNAGGAGAATYDGIKFVDAQGTATVDKTNFKIAGGYVPAGAYGYVARQGQYTNLADNQSLFLTNFAPKDATVDGNGFLDGGEGVVPPKPTEVPVVVYVVVK